MAKAPQQENIKLLESETEVGLQTPDGIHFVKISGDGKSYTEKLVVQ